MRTKFKPLSILVAAAMGIAFSATVLAANTSKEEFQAQLKGVNDEYKAELSKCASGLEGHTCRVSARSNRDTAIDQARVKHGLEPITLDPSGAYVPAK